MKKFLIGVGVVLVVWVGVPLVGLIQPDSEKLFTFLFIIGAIGFTLVYAGEKR